jgi:predicted double-glycine peptidase
MGDLVVGLMALAVVAAALFVLTAHVSGRLSPTACDVAALAVVAALFGYIRCVWYSPRLAEWLPFSNLIVVGNWLPLFAAVIAGLVWRRTAHLGVRRVLTVAELGACGALAAIFPILGGVPQCDNHWDKLGTCLQTTDRTCSPACAATLLSRYGIAASEQEMAALCLTRQGTSWQGLYRGLALKAAGTGWRVEVISGQVEQLARLDGPAILSVGLPSGASAGTDFTHEFGWVPGVNHSVVLDGFTAQGHAMIADPALPMCREQWDEETLRTLWRGYAVRLVRQDAHAAE